MSTVELHKSWAELKMAKFDNLSPEWRALVREYNIFPMSGETIDSYLNHIHNRSLTNV